MSKIYCVDYHKSTYVFEFVALSLPLIIPVYFVDVLLLAQFFDERFKRLLVALVHDDSRNTIVVVYQPCVLMGQVLEGRLDIIEGLFDLLLIVLDYFGFDLVGMSDKTQAVILVFYLLQRGFRRNV